MSPAAVPRARSSTALVIAALSPATVVRFACTTPARALSGAGVGATAILAPAVLSAAMQFVAISRLSPFVVLDRKSVV